MYIMFCFINIPIHLPFVPHGLFLSTIFFALRHEFDKTKIEDKNCIDTGNTVVDQRIQSKSVFDLANCSCSFFLNFNVTFSNFNLGV